MFENLFAQRGLSLDRLKAFVEVDEAGGMAKAAVGDPVRQSQYSRQIKELEEYFGVELIRRKGKGIELTRVGKELATLVREQFSGLSDFHLSCSGAPVRFSLGAGDSLLHWLLTPCLSQLQAKMPQMGVRLHNMRSVDIIRELHDLSIDFGIVREGVEGRLLEKRMIGSFDYAFYVPKSMVGRKRRVDIKEILKQIPLATQGSDGSFRQNLEGNALRKGVRLNIRLNCESFPQAYQALLSGGYAAVLPTFIDPFIDNKRTVRLEVDFMREQRRTISLRWNKRLIRVRPLAEKVAIGLVRALKSQLALH
ncbi:MAG: LysR family transcriptional regulator [Verrucomicrobiota bacterium]